MAGTLSSVNLIAAAGIIGNIGGVPISANATAINNLNSYSNIAVVTQFSTVKSTGASVLSGTAAQGLNNLAGNIFPALTNTTPTAYIGSLGNTPASGFTSVVTTEINNILGGGDLGKFEQVFNYADSYRFTTNQLINSTVNANNSASNSTYTSQNNTMSAGLSQISLASKVFGEELAALGYSIDFSTLSDIGSPQGLLRQIYIRSGGSTVISTALLNAGISSASLSNIIDTPWTDEEQKIAFDVMTKITGSQLNQILYVLKVTTLGLKNLADLLNPVMMFPQSFNTLTAPTANGLRGIYIDSSGAINTKLATTLPSNVLAPVQGYQTVTNTYSQLKKIIPPDWALANKALQAGLEQIKSVFGTTMPLLGAATAGLESTKGLDLINSLSSPLPAAVSSYFTTTLGSGTGENGTILLADIIGTAGGWIINGNLPVATSVVSSMESAGALVTLTNGTNGVFTVMQNAINGVYGIPDGTGNVTLDIPPGLPGAGTYLTYNAAFTGPGSPGTGLLPAAYSLIGTIVTNDSANVSVANSAWANMAAQLVLEQTTQAQANIVFSSLIAGTSVQSLASGIGQYGTDTAVGGPAWFFESVANTLTQGGQAIVASLREARNLQRLNAAGVGNDIEVNDERPTPQISVTPGQYTVSEAVAQKII